MRRLPLFSLCLLIASAATAAAEGLGVSAERVRDALRVLPQFQDAKIEENITDKTRGFSLTAEPKDRSDMVIEMYGARANLEAVFVTMSDSPDDPRVLMAIGLLIPILVRDFGPPPAWTAKTITDEEMPPAMRWPEQFRTELTSVRLLELPPYLTWHAGGRSILVTRREERPKQFLVYFFRGAAMRPDWGSAPPPKSKAVASALAAFGSGRYDAALAELRALAAGGDAEAQAWLAEAMYFNRGVGLTATSVAYDARHREIAALIEAATTKNDPHAQYWRAIRIRRGSEKGSREDALGWYLKAAMQGHAAAQFEVALGLVGNDAREAEATAWFELSARLGHWPSMIGIAGQHEAGHGVPMDAKLAYYWYRVFELRFPQPAGIDPDSLRQMSVKVAGDVDDADQARLDAEAGRWKPESFADLRRACGQRRCPKELVR